MAFCFYYQKKKRKEKREEKILRLCVGSVFWDVKAGRYDENLKIEFFEMDLDLIIVSHSEEYLFLDRF